MTAKIQRRPPRGMEIPKESQSLKSKLALPVPIQVESKKGDSYILIGEIKGAHGLRGRVKIRLFHNLPWVEAIKKVYLELNEVNENVRSENKMKNLYPFIVEWRSTQKNAYICRLENVIYIEQAEQFSGSKVFIYTKDIPKEIEGGTDIASLYRMIGFNVADKTGNIGKITGITHSGAQWLLEIVLQSKKEVLLPFVAEFILKIDEKNRIIHISPPEGLFDL